MKRVIDDVKYIFHELSKVETLKGKLHLSESNDALEIKFHEYMRIDIWSDYVLLNKGLTHWHGDDDDIIEDTKDIVAGNIIFVERRCRLTQLCKLGFHLCDNTLIACMKKERFDKKGKKYLTKKRLRIYSGNTIIKRSD